jgi:hypothetical protein
MDRPNGQELTADELRAVAHFVEETALDVLADAAAIDFPLAQGDLKVFPRPSPADRAAAFGFTVLRESTEQAAAALHALAAVREAGLEVPEALLPPLEGYIDAFNRARPAKPEVAPPEGRPGGGEQEKSAG